MLAENILFVIKYALSQQTGDSTLCKIVEGGAYLSLSFFMCMCQRVHCECVCVTSCYSQIMIQMLRAASLPLPDLSR